MTLIMSEFAKWDRFYAIVGRAKSFLQCGFLHGSEPHSAKQTV
jgi:hypothetical protein